MRRLPKTGVRGHERHGAPQWLDRAPPVVSGTKQDSRDCSLEARRASSRASTPPLIRSALAMDSGASNALAYAMAGVRTPPSAAAFRWASSFPELRFKPQVVVEAID